MSTTDFQQVKPKKKKYREEQFMKPYSLLVEPIKGKKFQEISDYFYKNLNANVQVFDAKCSLHERFTKVFFENFDDFQSALELNGKDFHIEIDYSRIHDQIFNSIHLEENPLFKLIITLMEITGEDTLTLIFAEFSTSQRCEFINKLKLISDFHIIINNDKKIQLILEGNIKFYITNFRVGYPISGLTCDKFILFLKEKKMSEFSKKDFFSSVIAPLIPDTIVSHFYVMTYHFESNNNIYDSDSDLMRKAAEIKDVTEDFI